MNPLHNDLFASMKRSSNDNFFSGSNSNSNTNTNSAADFRSQSLAASVGASNHNDIDVSSLEPNNVFPMPEARPPSSSQNPARTVNLPPRSSSMDLELGDLSSLKPHSRELIRKRSTGEIVSMVVAGTRQVEDAKKRQEKDGSSDYENAKQVKDPTLEPIKVFAPTARQQQLKRSASEAEHYTLLHKACQQYPRRKGVIKAAMQRDHSALRRRALIPALLSKESNAKALTTNKKSNAKTAKKKYAAHPEPFQLPINIALSNHASLEVLDLLVQADSQQLCEKDGIHGMNSLCIVMEQQRPDVAALLGMFLVRQPTLAQQDCDGLGNTPLHVACHKGLALPIIRQLYQLYPLSLQKPNHSGQTPLDLLQELANRNLQVGNSHGNSHLLSLMQFLREKLQQDQLFLRQQQQLGN